MFGSKKNRHPGKQQWNAFFSDSVEIEGTLRFTGLLNIDGRLKGAIVAKGMLVTGSNANVHGDVFVENLILSGSVTGNIFATGEVHLNQSAKVLGNINYQTLSIVPGALHEGNSHRFTEEERIELIAKIQTEIGALEEGENNGEKSVPSRKAAQVQTPSLEKEGDGELDSPNGERKANAPLKQLAVANEELG
ncbi:MAG: polymer-forming cytoskeletal protein [Deltaproteobacteria bacterium]|jgi:cytoskeletal protein CcmA (bactofilin family)|nr:polymer-forming cytoskeletal protein [Deltaproteobacteria bacterium]